MTWLFQLCQNLKKKIDTAWTNNAGLKELKAEHPMKIGDKSTLYSLINTKGVTEYGTSFQVMQVSCNFEQ